MAFNQIFAIQRRRSKSAPYYCGVDSSIFETPPGKNSTNAPYCGVDYGVDSSLLCGRQLHFETPEKPSNSTGNDSIFEGIDSLDIIDLFVSEANSLAAKENEEAAAAALVVMQQQQQQKLEAQADKTWDAGKKGARVSHPVTNSISIFLDPAFLNAVIEEYRKVTEPHSHLFSISSPKSKVTTAEIATADIPSPSKAQTLASKQSEMSKKFWADFRLSHPCLDKSTLTMIQKAVKTHKRKKRRDQMRKTSVSTRGRLLSKTAAVALQNTPPRSIPIVTPTLQTGTMSSTTTRRIAELNNRLKSRLKSTVGAAGQKDARDSNYGYSLSRTCVTGGSHSDRTREISGSIHFNKNIVRNPSQPRTEQQELQDSVIALMETSLYEAFGKTTWYKGACALLSDVPQSRMLPSHTRLPVSHVWWTYEPEFLHWHIDTNTVGPAFVFTPEDYDGGDLMVMTETGLVRHKFKAGQIVGGHWQQLPHCNTKIADGEDRRSFVLYLDKRVLSSRYICK